MIALGLRRLLFLAICCWSAGQGYAGETTPLRVFVSVLPLQTFVERIGGERVQVHTMVRPGHSPATYDPTPKQVARLAATDLYVRIGVPFERAWMPRIQSANPDLLVLDARQGLTLRPDDRHRHEDFEADHKGTADPHVWTDPQQVEKMAGSIRDQLVALDPAGRATYAAGHASLVSDLHALDRELQTRLAPLTGLKFLVFHPAWGYFAARYGLVQVAVEPLGKQTGARALAELVERARSEGARVIFVQPQFDRKLASQVAHAMNGRVESLDPLAPDYFVNLRRFASALEQAYRG
jgi:zinc transport system substrate-binding protein